MIENIIEFSLLIVCVSNVVMSVILALLAELPHGNGARHVLQLLFWSQAASWLCVLVISVQALVNSNTDMSMMILANAAGTFSIVAKYKILLWLRK